MHIRSLAGKKVCILGYGKEGRAMVQALEEYAPGCQITIADRNEKIQIPHLRQGFGGRANSKFQVQLGNAWLKNIDRFDIVIKSPGIPPKELSSFHFSLFTSSTQIFLDSIKDSGATVIGVTGSKGKSTTSSLIFEMLKAAKKNVFFVGNIGDPSIAHLKDAKSNTIFVQEMSSYQLMDLTLSPHIAVITSFFPEHLDYHSTRPATRDSLMASHVATSTPLENYLEAKKHITRFQTKNDVVIFNADSREAKEIADESKGKKIPFTPKDSPVKLSEISLLGEHNLGNIAGAYKTAIELGIDKEIAIDAIRKFRGLSHRLESVAIKDGVEWINDSISTTPETAIAALNALGGRVQTIILGGQDRGYDFTELGKRIKESKIQTVILFPDTGSKIRAAIEKADANITCIDASNMEEAIVAAKRQTQTSNLKTQNSSIVLLSPASPSYNLFKNFEDRGNQFRTLAAGQ